MRGCSSTSGSRGGKLLMADLEFQMELQTRTLTQLYMRPHAHEPTLGQLLLCTECTARPERSARHLLKPRTGIVKPPPSAAANELCALRPAIKHLCNRMVVLLRGRVLMRWGIMHNRSTTGLAWLLVGCCHLYSIVNFRAIIQIGQVLQYQLSARPFGIC